MNEKIIPYQEAENLIKNNPQLRKVVDNLVWWGVKYALNIYKNDPDKLIKMDWINEFTDCNLGLMEIEELTIRPTKLI